MAGAAFFEQLYLVGLHQRGLIGGLRDQFFAEEPDPAHFLTALERVPHREAGVVVTCERIELLVVTDEGECGSAPQAVLQALSGIISDFAGARSGEEALPLYHYRGGAAAAHIFRTAASLDSQVVGEPQILGQVKENYRHAMTVGKTGPLLDAVFPAAFAAAKRVRTETPLAEQPVSIAASALQVARQLHGDLRQRRALLIGLGEMCELLGAELQKAAVPDIVVTHESAVRAEAAAARLSCHFLPMAELDHALTEADIVVSDRGAGSWTITKQMVAAALKRRRNRPIFLIDAAMPGDIEASTSDLSDAFLYDLGDLEAVALKGRASRQMAVQLAQDILDQELSAFERRHRERAAGPTIGALRAHFEAVRQEVLADPKLDRDSATRLLVNRLLHRPSEILRHDASGEAADDGAVGDPDTFGQVAEAARLLFGLQSTGQGGTPESGLAGQSEKEASKVKEKP